MGQAYRSHFIDKLHCVCIASIIASYWVFFALSYSVDSATSLYNSNSSLSTFVDDSSLILSVAMASGNTIILESDTTYEVSETLLLYKEQLSIQGGTNTVIKCRGRNRAFMLQNAELNISSVTITGCSEMNGGALYAIDSKLHISNVNFLNNAGLGISSRGGAIYAINGNIEISDSLFSQNTATYGGALAISGTNSLLNNCTFSMNQVKSNGFGGALLLSGECNHTLNYCSFIDNSGERGGVIAQLNNTVASYAGCSFISNNAYYAGGLYPIGNSIGNFYNCTIVGNIAVGSGGVSETTFQIMDFSPFEAVA